VLLIGEDAEHLRALIALLVSIAFLASDLYFKPLKRCGCSRFDASGATPAPRTRLAVSLASREVLDACRTENAMLMALIELMLIIAYICVILVKTCDESENICGKYGLGTSKGNTAPPASAPLWTMSRAVVGPALSDIGRSTRTA
jgi:hypothetical protein